MEKHNYFSLNFLDKGLGSYLAISWSLIVNGIWKLPADFLRLKQAPSQNCCLDKSNLGRQIKTSKDLLFHKSDNNTRKKNFSINLFRTLEIIQRIIIIQGLFIKEK